MDDEEEDEVTLREGSVVESSKGAYVIIKLLGEGGFGAVYKVHDKKDIRKEYAMKVEKKLQTRRHSKLKMEIAILKLVGNERSASHFTAIIDRGKKEKFFFLVMQLVGQSLAALKMSRPEKIFSISTGLGAGIQCLEACQDLHKYGFIHRDLKPANYACGLGEKRRIIYILDFGIARKILNAKGELKAPRQSVRFKGTIRFASIACHKNLEMGPKDDCESWFYLLLDLILPRGVIWKSVIDKNLVRRLKEEMRSTRRGVAFYGIKCKPQLESIMDYLDTLQYQDRVDYDYIYKLLEMGATVAGGDIKKPYDWEIGDDPTQSITGEEKPRTPRVKKKKRKKSVDPTPVGTPLLQKGEKPQTNVRASAEVVMQNPQDGSASKIRVVKEKRTGAVRRQQRSVSKSTAKSIDFSRSLLTNPTPSTASRGVKRRTRRRKKETSSSESDS